MRASQTLRRGGRRSLLLAGVYGLIGLPVAWAHDVRLGSLVIDHPYALPSVPARSLGVVYVRGIRNRGDRPDRLLSASTPVAERVSLHRSQMDGDVMRMREVTAIELPSRSEIRLGHTLANGHHLMLEGLKAPLKDGDRFPLTLRFETAGQATVQVWVQNPRQAAIHRHEAMER